MKTKATTILIACILFSIHSVIAQINISGKVSDELGQPLTGVIVTADNYKRGIRTKANGVYQINVQKNTKQLVFSHPGYNTEKININKQNVINVTLFASTKIVEECDELVISHPMRVQHTGTQQIARMTFKSQSAITTHYDANFNTEDYSTIHESGFRDVKSDPLSTFSIDVDNASYSNIRRFLNNGQMPHKDVVRTEEMLNYFNYNYEQPDNNVPFNITTEYTSCPWNRKHNLALVAIQGKDVKTEDLPAANLVFLLDVSGSMNAQNKLPLVKSSMRMLVKKLRPQDKVAIVVYAGAAGLTLESTPGSNKKKIIAALDKLSAGGSTAGGEGLLLAYKTASENFIKGGNNRIILATDGDFNIGQSSDAEMERLVEQQRNNGIFMTVLGFGMGNYKDNKLETIANNGNGNYAYIDNSQEAHKVFIQQFGGTLFTIAKDVKFQVEFNPAKVQAYRLIGYENRKLNNEDFNNDKKDAGELGAGHSVTALYEIVPAGTSKNPKLVDKLKYQKNKVKNRLSTTNELMNIKLRYKAPDGNTSQLIQQVLRNELTPWGKTTNNIRFAAAVTQFGMLLRDSEFKGNSTITNTIELAKSAKGDDEEDYRGEFIRLIKTADSIGLTDNNEI